MTVCQGCCKCIKDSNTYVIKNANDDGNNIISDPQNTCTYFECKGCCICDSYKTSTSKGGRQKTIILCKGCCKCVETVTHTCHYII